MEPLCRENEKGVNTAIVLAGGCGSRMRSDIPKQYLELSGKPVLYYSLKQFEDCPLIDEIVLVVRKDDLSFCREQIVRKYAFTKVTRIVPGGTQRYESVENGLAAMKKEGYVFIHDGARPCIDRRTVERLYREAQEYGTAVAAVPAKDTVRIVDEEGFSKETPDRATVWNIQTPQVFLKKLILDAYAAMHEKGGERGTLITDDAMIAERYSGQRIRITMGDYRNIKITTPEDLAVAEILKNLGDLY